MNLSECTYGVCKMLCILLVTNISKLLKCHILLKAVVLGVYKYLKCHKMAFITKDKFNNKIIFTQLLLSFHPEETGLSYNIILPAFTGHKMDEDFNCRGEELSEEMRKYSLTSKRAHHSDQSYRSWLYTVLKVSNDEIKKMVCAKVIPNA